MALFVVKFLLYFILLQFFSTTCSGGTETKCIDCDNSVTHRSYEPSNHTCNCDNHYYQITD